MQQGIKLLWCISEGGRTVWPLWPLSSVIPIYGDRLEDETRLGLEMETCIRELFLFLLVSLYAIHLDYRMR